jgi:exodeoxyribonuclease VII large subunit
MAFQRPEMLVQERAQRVDEQWQKLEGCFEHDLAMRRERVNTLVGKLEALSPLKVMERGFSVAFGSSNEILTSVEEVEVGDKIMTRLGDGRIYSRVQTVETTGNDIVDKELQNG